MSNNEILYYIRSLSKKNKNMNRKINILINKLNKVSDNLEELKQGYNSNDSLENSPYISRHFNKTRRNESPIVNDNHYIYSRNANISPGPDEYSSSSDESMEPLKAEYTIYKANLPDIKTFRGRDAGNDKKRNKY